MLKKTLIGVAVVALLVVVISVLALWRMKVHADRQAADVDELCAVPPGTSIDSLISKARALGFSEENQDPLGRGIEVRLKDQEKPVDWTDDTLPGINDGELWFGKIVISPFLRHYCRIEFKDRKVVQTLKRILD